MKKNLRDKLFRYVKDGRIKSIKSVLKKHEDVEIDDFVDSRNRTVLHVSCLLGEYAIAKVLINYGASIDVQDNNGNTPLHLALHHALQVLSDAVYQNLVQPLWRQASKRLLRQTNHDGETVRKLKKKFKSELKKRREDRRIYEEEEERIHNEAKREMNYEKEWNEKLFFEMRNDEEEMFAGMNDYDINEETYDQWADRIKEERHQKYYVNNKSHTKTSKNERKQKEYEAQQRTEYLQKKHEEYIKEMSQKRAKSRAIVRRAEYEEKCNVAFNLNESTLLKYNDIPWPCDGSATDMIKLIQIWTESEEDGKKFLKKQQIRWHPDRFIQKCGDRLDTKDKEMIMTAVNQLSQGINALIDS